jgi:TatD DNase family protein
MKLIDTHCHIYSDEFDPDRTAMLARAQDEGITNMLMPAIDSSTHKQMFELENEFQQSCKSMMGLHPCSVKEGYKDELRICTEWLEKRPFVAIGETGLDFYWDLTFTTEQYHSFQCQVEWALQYGVPIVIHSRNSLNECIDVINKNQKGNLRGVFHCFTGSLEQAKQIIDLNFHLGIGGVLTFKKSGLDTLIEQIDLTHVVLETDAPYLAPVPFRGKRNECSYIRYIAQKLSEIKQMPIDEIAEITTANAEKLFRL